MSISKKQRSSLKKGRPASIAQPQVIDTSNQYAFRSFSPDGDLFAYITLSIDKHRLRVYDTTTGQSVAEYIVESARVTSLSWASLDLSEAENQPSKSKRRRKNSNTASESARKILVRTLVLGLSNGTLLLFSSSHARVMRKLSHPSSTAAIVSVLVCDVNAPTIWTSGADSTIRIWDISSSDVIGNWKNDERMPYSSMAMRSTSNTEDEQILLAHHNIKLSSASLDDLEGGRLKSLASFTGHASPVNVLEWDMSQSPSQRFFSSAEGDRLVYMWQVPEKEATQGKQLASFPVDSGVTDFTLLTGKLGQTLVVLSSSGKVSVFYIPDDTFSTREDPKVLPFVPRSQIYISPKTGVLLPKIVSISPVADQEGCIRICRVSNGVRPVFDTVRYLDDSENFVQNVVLEDTNDTDAPGTTQQMTYSRRYTEGTGIAVTSGAGIYPDESQEGETVHEGELNIDLAELSLGQRLTIMPGGEQPPSETDPGDSDSGPGRKAPKKRRKAADVSAIPTNSLTRTLIQALHSSDSRLLEACLKHSDISLISNSVKRLPPQLAVPLIIACADRLGRGARSANLKGRGGGASSQRGSTLVVWIRTILAVHSGHLMTVPDLVARLSGLHATLAARLSLQDSLLSLSGRLDLVLSQMQMRSSAAPAPLGSGNAQVSKAGSTEVTRYVEGESGESGAEGDLMDMEDESDDNGSIEDVELRGDSEDGDSEESDQEAEESEDDDDGDEPAVNGFIDDEAEEYSQEDESGSE